MNPIKPNHGVKNTVTCHLTRETAKSCNAPLTRNVINIASGAGNNTLSGLITLRDK